MFAATSAGVSGVVSGINTQLADSRCHLTHALDRRIDLANITSLVPSPSCYLSQVHVRRTPSANHPTALLFKARPALILGRLLTKLRLTGPVIKTDWMITQVHGNR